MFFDNWDTLLRTLIIGICAYTALLFLLRISGKRTLAKMNAFDFVVTVAVGSTLATILLNKDVTLAEGVLALSVLIFLQFIITWFSVRYSAFNKLIKSEPKLLFHNGRLLPGAMKNERISEGEIYQAVRDSGIGSIEDVEAVIIETNGSLNALKKSSGKNNSIRGYKFS